MKNKKKKGKNKTCQKVPPGHRSPSTQPALDIAVALYAAGKYAEALALIEPVLAAQSTNIVAINIAAACSRALGKVERAEKYWLAAVRIQPDYTEALNNLGVLLKEQRRFAEAEQAFRRVLAVRPDDAEAQNTLGVLLHEQRRFIEAEEAFRRALSLRPDHADAHSNLGMVLKEQRRFTEAEDAFRRALVICPGHTGAHCNLGMVLGEQQRFAEAEGALRRALAICPSHADAHSNLGMVLREQQRFTEAEEAYHRALVLHPDHVGARNNLGMVLVDHRRFAEAEDAYRRALTIRPGHVDARFNLSLLLLLQGRFDEGWPLYEARLDPNRKEKNIPLPNLPFPQWAGEPLHGKSILVWPEQGFGDEIQFVRYLPLLKSLGAARVTLVCKSPLEPLFDKVPGADQVIGLEGGIMLESHDFWTLPLSLPLRFHTRLETIPAKLPYLATDTVRMEKWAARLPATGCTVGLVWKGSGSHKNDANRSLPGLEILKPLWSVAGISFVSLQKGNGEDEVGHPPPDQPIRNLGPDIRDFADTAALVAQLDLLICVDTAIAHLAGALGRPCWVLLPRIGTDWRWLEDREDSPWYPGVMRLFRQAVTEGWTETIEKVAEALALWSATRQESAGCSLVAPAVGSQGLPPPPLPGGQQSVETAVALYASGKYAEALALIEPVLAAQPTQVVAINIAAACSRALGKVERAEKYWLAAVRIQPDYTEALNNLGVLLKEQRRFAEAEQAFRRVLAVRPDDAEAQNTLGVLLHEQRRFIEAEEAFRRALSLRPDHADAHSNLGMVLKEQRRFTEAEDAFRRALVIRPDYADAKFNLSLLLLFQGRFDEGWPLYEARSDPSRNEKIDPRPTLPFPRWASEPLHGKSILVWPEQGFGDEIQFVRYLPLLKSLGAARVTLVCKPPLAPLFDKVSGADQVIGLEGRINLKPHDYWTFALSLPLRCQTTLDNIPATLPYLTADETRRRQWVARLPATGLRVGLVWKGSGSHKNDANRSLPGLEILKPLWSVAGISFVSLQKGNGEDEVGHPPPDQPIRNLGPDIRDFADTAALVAQLDLLICVDTAIAHLAGALGRPCWVLLPPIGTDWRWLEDREDSPWYPGVMRLFRQAGTEGWTETIEEVTAALDIWRGNKQRCPACPDSR